MEKADQLCDIAIEKVDCQSTVINQEIDRPSHYGSKSGKDVIDWCEDFGIMNNAYVYLTFLNIFVEQEKRIIIQSFKMH